MKEKYICSEAEYNAINKVMHKSKMEEGFYLTQIQIDDDRSDVWLDEERAIVRTYISFSVGLTWMFEGFENQDNLYDLTDEEAKVLLDLDRRFSKVYEKDATYKTLLCQE